MASDTFSSDYVSARDRFSDAARAAGADLFQLAWGARGPHDERLTIDIARLGAENPNSVLLITSGVHGVEGFAGSAIQVQLLRNPPKLSNSSAMILIHCVNPYGMAWLRRSNENNIDLNRNFLEQNDQYAGTPDAYRRLNRLLNPTGHSKRVDMFYPSILWHILRYGYKNSKQAVTGQYDYPRGLFFGGHGLEQGPSLVLDWLKRSLQGAERCIALDIHTGLGSYGDDALLVSYPPDSERFKDLKASLGDRIETLDPEDTAYRFKGGFLDGLEREMPHLDWTCIGQEFGTLNSLRVLNALRQENRFHHYGKKELIDHPAKQQLLRAFCPDDDQWRQQILKRGRELVDTVLCSPNQEAENEH